MDNPDHYAEYARFQGAVTARNPRKVEGILRRYGIVRAYDLAMQHKQEAALHAEEARLEATAFEYADIT